MHTGDFWTKRVCLRNRSTSAHTHSCWASSSSRDWAALASGDMLFGMYAVVHKTAWWLITRRRMNTSRCRPCHSCQIAREGINEISLQNPSGLIDVNWLALKFSTLALLLSNFAPQQVSLKALEALCIRWGLLMVFAIKQCGEAILDAILHSVEPEIDAYFQRMERRSIWRTLRFDGFSNSPCVQKVHGQSIGRVLNIYRAWFWFLLSNGCVINHQVHLACWRHCVLWNRGIPMYWTRRVFGGAWLWYLLRNCGVPVYWAHLAFDRSWALFSLWWEGSGCSFLTSTNFTTTDFVWKSDLFEGDASVWRVGLIASQTTRQSEKAKWQFMHIYAYICIRVHKPTSG